MDKKVLEERKIEMTKAIKERIAGNASFEDLNVKELMQHNKKRTKVMLKGARKTKANCAMSIFEEIQSTRILNSERLRLHNILEESLQITKGQIHNLKELKKYINKSLRTKDYDQSGLVNAILNAIGEVDYEINIYRDNAYYDCKYPRETFTYDNMELFDSIDEGVKVLTKKA